MKQYILLALTALLLASCGSSNMLTRGSQYPKMYEERPLAIVVMPPINQTNHVEAKDYFYTTLYSPLCEKGYYVYSPMMTMEMFQTESAYDAEQFIEGNLSKYLLRSTKTGETLYKREGLITVDTSVSNNGGGLLGALAGLAATAISTAATDKVVAGRKCTAYVLSDLPEGKYGQHYGKDQEMEAGKSYIEETVR